jgi:hypothetical protein
MSTRPAPCSGSEDSVEIPLRVSNELHYVVALNPILVERLSKEGELNMFRDSNQLMWSNHVF